MTDAFASLVGPIFEHVLDLLQRIEAGEQPAFDAERKAILGLISDADRRAAQSEGLKPEWALARFALVYWIDEVLINSGWRHAQDWREHILEYDFYGERERAERFPQKAEEARRLRGGDALETFYLCAATGYSRWCIEGRRDGREAFLAWGQEIYREICDKVARNGVQPEKFLPDEDAAGAPLEPLPGKSILLAASALVAITVLITLACFVLAIPPWEG